MAINDDILSTLRSIDATLLKLLVLSQERGQAQRQGQRQRQPQQQSLPRGGDDVPAIASDKDLDSKYGNPKVGKKDPRDWTGPSYTGHPFSECPPDYLEAYAGMLDWAAAKCDERGETSSNGKPLSTYKRLDAARARGWAKRNRSGYTPPAPPPMVTDEGSDYQDPLLDGPAFEEEDPMGGGSGGFH